MEIIHNIEKEKELIGLLGYYLEGPNSSNRWTIWNSDKREEICGYIQYKKLHNGDKSKGTPKIFGYHMLINSPKVKCASTREKNDNATITYKLEITNGRREDVDSVHLTMGDYPGIIIRSAKYGYIDFHFDNQALCLRFGSITDNFKVIETFVFQNVEDPQYRSKNRYVYHIEYCKNNHELSDDNPKWKTTREISGEQVEDDELKIRIKTWVHGKPRLNVRYNALGTVEEMAKRQQMGIDAFSCFRCILDKVFLNQEDVLSKIVGEDMIKERGLSVLFDGYEEPQKQSKL